MHDLLTPDDLAEINDAAHNLRAEKFFHDADRVFALLRHIAALEARTPAPALPADMETLLADAGYKAVLAREQAEPYRHALEQRMICANMEPLLTGNADADLMRFVFAEQELALSPEVGTIAELRARAEKAEHNECCLRAALEELGYTGAVPEGVWDALAQRAEKAEADLAAARKELAGLGPVEREQASPNIDMWWPERVTDLECRTNRRRAIRRVLEGGAA